MSINRAKVFQNKHIVGIGFQSDHAQFIRYIFHQSYRSTTAIYYTVAVGYGADVFLNEHRLLIIINLNHSSALYVEKVATLSSIDKERVLANGANQRVITRQKLVL